MCRTRHLIDSDNQLLALASPSLRSLSSEPCKDFQVHMGRLTALTRLEVIGFDLSKVQLLWEQLAVQELIATRCSNACAPFFLPAAMPALQKLHVEEVKMLSPILSQNRRQDMVRELMDRPPFNQISGGDSFFRASMDRPLATWCRSAFTEHSIQCHTDTPHDELTVWTRPDS